MELADIGNWNDARSNQLYYDNPAHACTRYDTDEDATLYLGQLMQHGDGFERLPAAYNDDLPPVL